MLSMNEEQQLGYWLEPGLFSFLFFHFQYHVWACRFYLTHLESAVILDMMKAKPLIFIRTIQIQLPNQNKCKMCPNVTCNLRSQMAFSLFWFI